MQSSTIDSQYRAITCLYNTYDGGHRFLLCDWPLQLALATCLFADHPLILVNPVFQIHEAKESSAAYEGTLHLLC